MRVTSFRSTYCFVDVDGHQAQVVRVVVAGAPSGAAAYVTVSGRDLVVPAPWKGALDAGAAGEQGGPAWAPANDPLLSGPGRFSPSAGVPEGVVVEVPVVFPSELAAGAQVPARAVVEVGGHVASCEGQLVVREPGWRMIMVPHFHYDPVWWNTQAGYTSAWDELLWAQERRDSFQHTGLALVEAHLERARTDPAYKFVLAEVDYLKPFWDLYPDRRSELRALVAAGRLEIVGGTYNEPNTNLTGAETAIRTAIYGLGFQRDVIGARPESAWQLDVFGHDPQFPGIMADCGLRCSAWARGPFHQWGPKKEVGSNAWMQFPSEFEWIAPNGRGLLTSYMPNHYSAGWELEMASTLEGAMWNAYEIFCDLAEVSATKVTLMPVGTDYTPPGLFTTEVASAWSKRYSWPRFEVGLPSEFFAAVRAELSAGGLGAAPQTRDMGPVYTGKDVSYIDTKQAQRLAEVALADAEAMAALAQVLGAPVPQRELDKAWRQLVFGAHHDGITGSESDQVYLDLLGGWRESYELARRVEERSRRHVLSFVATGGDGAAVVVTNALGWERSDVVDVALPAGSGLVDEAGNSVPVMRAASTPKANTCFLATNVPGIGYKTFQVKPLARELGTWSDALGTAISNEHFEAVADPARGGALVSLMDQGSGYQLLPGHEAANELVLYPEYAGHPRFGEGPWHLLPSGEPARSSSSRATVRVQRSPLGERLIAEGSLGPASPPGCPAFQYRQVIVLWNGLRRVDFMTEVHGWSVQDQLLRLRFPTRLQGATPICAVGDAVVARSFALIDVDSGEHPWTLDSPAAEWFGLSRTLVFEICENGSVFHQYSLGVGELVVPAGAGSSSWARDLLVNLLRKGVTVTCSEAQRNRYGALLGDSNLPDFRIAVGRPEENPFVAAVLGRANPAYGDFLAGQLVRQPYAFVFVPAERPLPDVWRPGADLRDPRSLPVLVVAAREGALSGALTELGRRISSGKARFEQPSALTPETRLVPNWTVALANRGTPGFAVTADAAMHVSLLRACTGWPSGVWIDPPRRSAPDGSAFQLEHWSHVFHHALFFEPGDWRAAGCVEKALAYNRPLRATPCEPHDGPLPTSTRLLGLGGRNGKGSGEGRAILAALKPAGNPLASSDPGSGQATDGEVGDDAEVTLRCYEAHGSAASVEVGAALPVAAIARANLLEQPEPWAGPAGSQRPGEAPSSRDELALGPYELATLRLRFKRPRFATSTGAGGPGQQGTDDVEPAQPVFSRYWLHNKGAAPMGNQAIAVHVWPISLSLRAGETGQLMAQVASGSARATQAGHLEVSAPSGWRAEPPARIFSLAPGAYVQVPVTFQVPPRCPPGRYFIAARAADGAGQVQQDVMTVDVLPQLAAREGSLPAGPPPPFSHPGGEAKTELGADLEVERLSVEPRALASLVLRLANRALGQVHGEVQLLSPVETWPYIHPWSQGFALAPGEERCIQVSVQGPDDGWLRSWALFKVMYFGRLWYSPSMELALGPVPLSR